MLFIAYNLIFQFVGFQVYVRAHARVWLLRPSIP